MGEKQQAWDSSEAQSKFTIKKNKFTTNCQTKMVREGHVIGCCEKIVIETRTALQNGFKILGNK